MTEKSQDTENKGRFNNIEHKQKLKIIKYDRAVKNIMRGKSGNKRLSWRNNFIREKRKNLEIQIKQIIEFVEKNNEITRIDLENMLNIKESRARELLRYSVENNILEKLGKTRNIKYVKK